jgi:hypothetical protein
MSTKQTHTSPGQLLILPFNIADEFGIELPPGDGKFFTLRELPEAHDAEDKPEEGGAA